MYYFKIDDDVILKYEVTLDKERLQSLRKEIIDKCSKIEVVYEKEFTFVNKSDDDNDKKYWYKMHVEEIKNNEQVLYYAYHIHPTLANLISDLLLGKTAAIGIIENLTEDISLKQEENIILEERLNILKNTFTDNKERMIYQNKLLDKNMKKLMKYYQEKKLNEKQISAIYYKNDVLNAINLQLVDIISLETLRHLKEFTNGYNKSTLDNQLNSLLCLERNI